MYASRSSPPGDQAKSRPSARRGPTTFIVSDVLLYRLNTIYIDLFE